MARLIQNELKKPLAEAILFGELKDGGRVRLGVRGDALHIEVLAAPAPATPPPTPALA